MSIHLSDYSANAFSDILPRIGYVWKHINVRGGRDVIIEKLGPIFRKHQVDEKLGIAVLHPHFDLTPNERLVELNDVSTPWDAASAARVGGSIVPTSWLFRDSKLVPYKYSFVDAEATAATVVQPAQFPAFLEELGTTLKQLKLQRYLALTVHPPPDFKGSVEFTVGRANFSVDPGRVSISHTLDSTFFFDPKYNARGVAAKCEAGKCDVGLTTEELAKMEELD